MHTIRNALAALLLLPCILRAEPPVEWRAELSSREVATLYASHGDTRAIECRLTLKGAPYVPETATFHYSTNGFAGPGWEAPVSISSNLASIAWSPALDPGADMLALLLTLDGTHTAAALLHLRPGPAPGDALPPPTRVLDFSQQPYTNAPWALPSDIPPAPDLSAYATTGLVASLHPPFDEYAAPAYAWIDAAPDYEAGGLRLVETGDVCRAETVDSGIAALRLSALEELRTADGSRVRALDGAWSIAAGSAHATLSGDLLQPTGETGPVSVQFARSDGGDALRATFAMQMAPARTGAWEIYSESTNTWRRAQGDILADYFRSIPTNGVRTAYRHGRGNEQDYWCTLYLAQQIYVTNEVKNPTTANPSFFLPPWVGFFSVGRTDFQTYADTRPATMVSPHYAICAAHYTPSKATFPNGQTLSFTSVATLGDLRIIRADTAWTGDYRPSFLPSAILARKSPSLLAGTIGMYQSQHGTVHPCLVIPRTDSGSWFTVRPGGSFRWIGPGRAIRNATYADLDVYGHDVHGGDSGHAVCLLVNSHVVPVGLFSTTSGSDQSLLDDAVISWLDSNIRADSGGEESLHILTYEDL